MNDGNRDTYPMLARLPLRVERNLFAFRIIATAAAYAGTTLWLNRIRATAPMWSVWLLIVIQFALYFSIFYVGHRRAVVCGLNKYISFVTFYAAAFLGRVNDWDSIVVPVTVMVMLVVSARTKKLHPKYAALLALLAKADGPKEDRSD